MKVLPSDSQTRPIEILGKKTWKRKILKRDQSDSISEVSQLLSDSKGFQILRFFALSLRRRRWLREGQRSQGVGQVLDVIGSLEGLCGDDLPGALGGLGDDVGKLRRADRKVLRSLRGFLGDAAGFVPYVHGSQLTKASGKFCLCASSWEIQQIMQLTRVGQLAWLDRGLAWILWSPNSNKLCAWTWMGWYYH